jgi:hypothetical protein
MTGIYEVEIKNTFLMKCMTKQHTYFNVHRRLYNALLYLSRFQYEVKALWMYAVQQQSFFNKQLNR